jgi:hypothetical protein
MYIKPRVFSGVLLIVRANKATMDTVITMSFCHAWRKARKEPVSIAIDPLVGTGLFVIPTGVLAMIEAQYSVAHGYPLLMFGIKSYTSQGCIWLSQSYWRTFMKSVSEYAYNRKRFGCDLPLRMF